MNIERIQLTAPHEPEVATVELDVQGLGATEVLSETQYSLVSPGTELLGVQTAADHEFPYQVGYACVDRVTKTGAEIENLEAGDLVMNTGRHASHHRLETTETPVVPVPNGLDPKAAPFARLCGVSMPALQTTPISPPARLAVFGLGLVGNLACQMAGVLGYDVVGFEPIAARRDIADRCGVRTTLDPTAGDPEAMVDEEGLDSPPLLFECSGTADAIADAVTLAATEADIVQIGVPWVQTNPEVSAHQILNPLFRKYLTIRSGWEWQIPRFGTNHDRFSHSENYAHAMELLADGEINQQELLTHVVTPDEIGAAYEGLEEQKDEFLGVVVDWT